MDNLNIHEDDYEIVQRSLSAQSIIADLTKQYLSALWQIAALRQDIKDLRKLLESKGQNVV